jgi:multiple antibiotic resistance protein
MREYLHYVGLGLATILPIANPLTSATLLLALGKDFTPTERNRQIDRSAFYVAVILALCFYGGNAIMAGLGISIPGLRIAGGIILAYIGFTMLFPAPSAFEADALGKMNVKDKPRSAPRDIAFVPLAMPGTAGPGTIAVIVSAASTIHSRGGPTPVQHLAFFTVAAIVVALFWVCLRGATRVVAVLGQSGINAIARVMGFLLVCIGVQFGIDGILEIVALYAAERR